MSEKIPQPPLTANPEDAPEYIKKNVDNEGTPAEWRTKLSDTIMQFGKDVAGDVKTAGEGIAYAVMNPAEMLKKAKTGAERATAYGAYFVQRDKTLEEKAQKLKVDFIELTENYNKLPFRQKAYITAVLIGTSSLAAAAALPTLSSILAGGMYGQRALGGAGFALNRRKKMENSEHWLANRSDALKNTYATTLGAVYVGGTAVAGHYAIEKLTDWLGHTAELPATPPAAQPEADSSVPATPPVAPEVVPDPAPVPAAEAIAPVPVPEAVSTTIEMPTIETTPGKGYEYMAKRLWEQLQSQNLDASKFSPDSDIHTLLAADATTIDKVVHEIAADPKHGFFKLDGTSVRIDLGSQMTINADGNIQLGEVVKAPEGAPVTPVYPPPVELAPLPEETVAVRREPVMAIEEQADIPTAGPASVESLITNKFGLSISTAEAHVYADADAVRTFVFGGSPIERVNVIAEYLKENPNKVVFAPDDTGTYRIPWYMTNGEILPGMPMRTGGLFGFFSTWMKPPGPDDLQKIIR